MRSMGSDTLKSQTEGDQQHGTDNEREIPPAEGRQQSHY